jgi:hypothetical protein
VRPDVDICPRCDLNYDQFRTGLTFGDVWSIYWTQSLNPQNWKYKRRGTVLGKWHQIKLEMWDQHLAECWPDGGLAELGPVSY